MIGRIVAERVGGYDPKHPEATRDPTLEPPSRPGPEFHFYEWRHDPGRGFSCFVMVRNAPYGLIQHIVIAQGPTRAACMRDGKEKACRVALEGFEKAQQEAEWMKAQQKRLRLPKGKANG